MIAITSLIKNRAWILPYFLKSILNLEYNKEELSLIFIDDYSKDNSLEILNEFKYKYENNFNNIIILEPENYFSDNVNSRIINNRQKLYEHLSILRNKLIDKCKKINAEYQFSIDSDILINKDILNHLLSFKKEYIATLILNDNHLKDKFDYSNFESRYINAANFINNGLVHFKDYRLNNLYEVSMSGACYLISNKLFEYKFKHHKFGEDAGYCEEINKNFKIYLETTVKAIHVMEERYLNDALKVCDKYGK